MERIGKTRYALELVREALAREQKGLAVYGTFDPKKDTRILSREAIEESIDVQNYLTFLKRKYPHLSDRIMEAMRHNLVLYMALRQLESEERGLSESPPGTVAV